MQVPQPKLMMLLAAKWREFQAAGAEAPEAEEEAEEEDEEEEVIFRCLRIGILFPKLFWPTARNIVVVIEKNFWNLRLNAENLQKFWAHLELEQFFRKVKGLHNFWKK